MVRRNVEQQSDVGAELVNQLELKAADFYDRYSGVTCFAHPRDKRSPDVSRNDGWDARTFKNMTGKGSCGGLTIRAGDGHQPPAQKSPGQFYLAPNRNSRATCGRKMRQRGRHARAWHDQVLGKKC